jgi:tryptophan synthase alpha chain
VNRIDSIFADLRAARRKALMPFVCGGYPSAHVTAAVLPALEQAGASVVEVGIPFSDPIADGPVIAAAMHEALRAGATPESVFDEVASVRARVSAGLVAMCSMSIVERMGGVNGFASEAARAGFDGLIVPDAPLEESMALRLAAADAGLTLSLLVAPTTPADRAVRIAAACTGFVYLLARAGITGESTSVPRIAGRAGDLRRVTSLPIACGFGIGSAEQVRAVVGGSEGADAAIVGSALVRRMGEAGKAGGDPVRAGADFARELASGLN